MKINIRSVHIMQNVFHKKCPGNFPGYFVTHLGKFPSRDIWKWNFPRNPKGRKIWFLRFSPDLSHLQEKLGKIFKHSLKNSFTFEVEGFLAQNMYNDMVGQAPWPLDFIYSKKIARPGPESRHTGKLRYVCPCRLADWGWNIRFQWYVGQLYWNAEGETGTFH